MFRVPMQSQRSQPECDGADNKAKSKSVEDDESEIKVEVQHTITAALV